MPNNICHRETLALRAGSYWIAPYEAKIELYLELAARGWAFYVVDASRGFCHYGRKEITIPLWCIQRATNAKGQKRLVQYILHEIAHALDHIRNGRASGHGKPFMDILIEICPAELLVFEMTYKPRNLVAAGAIFCPDSLDF